jgi:primosomal protein N' (replication factor Y)
VTTEQENVAIDIAESFAKGALCTHLIHGITRSGKMEIYLHVMKNVLESGGDVIYLVPKRSTESDVASVCPLTRF